VEYSDNSRSKGGRKHRAVDDKFNLISKSLFLGKVKQQNRSNAMQSFLDVFKVLIDGEKV
jgi:hypothetical protein